MIVRLAALIFALACFGAQAGATTLADLIEGARKEGVLRGQWGQASFGGSEGFKEIVANMNKKYKLDLKGQYTPGPDMQALMLRVIQESAAGQPASTDVYLGNAQAMLDGLNAKVLKPMTYNQFIQDKPATEGKFNPIAADGTHVAVATAVVGVLYNTNAVKGNDIPKRIEDVLNPKWKGKIASTPYAASFDRLAMIWGEEKTTAFLEKFVTQVSGLIRCGEDDRIAAGEFAMLVFNCDLAAPQEAKEKGGPVDGQVFRDAGILSYWYVTVPSNARNPNAATLLAAFLLSKDGQDILYNTERSSSHLVKGTPMQKFVAEQEKRGVKFTSYSVSEVFKNAADHSRIRQKFQKILAGN